MEKIKSNVVALQKTLILQKIFQPIVYGASRRMNWFCARKWEMIIAMAVINEEKKTSRLPLIIRLPISLTGNHGKMTLPLTH